jgi:hypothetical protein
LIGIAMAKRKSARAAKVKIVGYPIGSPEGVQEAERRIAQAARTDATKLDLGGLGLTAIPESLLTLKQLETLYLGLPKEASELSHWDRTEEDKNSCNALSTLPPAFFASMQILQTLYLEHNQLAALPDDFGQLQRLRSLYLDNNQLAALPEAFGQLQSLQTLFLDHNRLAALPETFGELQRLQSLYLEDNQLAALPETLGQLRNLQMLFLNSNRLTALPRTFGQLQSLEVLFLDSNQLAALPETFSQLRSLQDLSLKNNEDLPPQYKKAWDEGGIAALAAAIRTFRNGDAHSAPKAKTEVKPPDIPRPRPAAVGPLWRNDILTLPETALPTDLAADSFLSALNALRAEFQEFVQDIDSEANIDRRFIGFAKNLADRIAENAPTQDELFRLGHAADVFSRYAKTANNEWPDFLAIRHHALSLQFDRTLQQSSLWREFKQNALKSTLTPEQVAESTSIAARISEMLRTKEALEFISRSVPEALDRLSDLLRGPDANNDWQQLIDEGAELLALDVIESINNILKPIAEAALKFARDVYWKGFSKGFTNAAKKAAPVHGEKAFKWLCRLVKYGSGGAVGVTTLSHLVTKYPNAFEWLQRVVDFIRHLATQVG